MKIGIVCYPTYGGSGVVATELGKALAGKGHQVHFITYSQPARLKSFHANLFYHEVRFTDYPLFEHPPYETALASKMVDVIKYEGLDLLHVHYAIPHASAAFIAKRILSKQGIELPVITTLHGTDITLVGRDETYEPVVTFSIEQSDGVTAVSEHLRDSTYQHFNIHNDIQVIPNFVDVARFNKSNKEHFKKTIAPNGEKVMIHVSNFRKVKRVEDIVKVFGKVLDHVPAKLILVGDGPERPNVEQLCRKLGTCDSIRFFGKQDAVEDLLTISDLFFMTSESESFGLAGLEAMASGVPLISSNAGGIPEINIHGQTGFLSDVGDVEDMTRNALYLLQDGNRLQQFSQQAVAQAHRYDIQQIVPNYEAFYEQMVERVRSTVV
jgi:N-acetyl-alpha-D-glucosaminyl L-malate synthase BshA